MDSKRIKGYIVYAIYVIAITASIIISIKITSNTVNDEILSTVSYLIQGNTNYKVYYKENEYNTLDYYDKTYFEKNNMKVSSNLIDKIDVEFDYHVNYSDIVSGSISYYLETILYVENNLNKSYIPDTKIRESYRSNTKDINKVITIDYNEYKTIYNNYINDLGEAYRGNAFIKVLLRVNNKVNYQSLDEIKDNNYLELDIPISEDPIDFKVLTDIKDEENTITVKDNVYNTKVFNTFAAVSMWIVTILLIVLVYIRYEREEMNASPYKRKLAKILRNHDDLIVNAKRLPNLSSYEVIETISFKELLDAQSEVDMPINFKEERKQATFVLIKDNLAWVYYLKEDKKD